MPCAIVITATARRSDRAPAGLTRRRSAAGRSCAAGASPAACASCRCRARSPSSSGAAEGPCPSVTGSLMRLRYRLALPCRDWGHAGWPAGPSRWPGRSCRLPPGGGSVPGGAHRAADPHGDERARRRPVEVDQRVAGAARPPGARVAVRGRRRGPVGLVRVNEDVVLVAGGVVHGGAGGAPGRLPVTARRWLARRPVPRRAGEVGGERRAGGGHDRGGAGEDAELPVVVEA